MSWWISGATCMYQEHHPNFLGQVGYQTSISSPVSARIHTSIWLCAWLWVIIFIIFSSNSTNHSHHQDVIQESHRGFPQNLFHHILCSLTHNDFYNRLFRLRCLRHQETIQKPHWLCMSIHHHRHVVNIFSLSVGISDNIKCSKVTVGFSHGLFVCGGINLEYTMMSIAGTLGTSW